MPVNHDKLVSMCDIHLVYLGFGAFLHLIPHLVVDVKVQELPILGHVVGCDPKTEMELTQKAIKQEKIPENDPPKSASAAAGSADQLLRVEHEMNASCSLLSQYSCASHLHTCECHLNSIKS